MHPQYTPVQIAHFWARIDTSAGPDACWPWLKATHGMGYGSLCLAGHGWLAHRLAWTLTHGPIPSELCVLHRCDNPPCCNPAHLWLGNRLDNNADTLAKGRYARRAGALSSTARLTAEQVRAIRERYAVGDVTQETLAQEYGVSRGEISAVVSYRTWRHVAPELAGVLPRREIMNPRQCSAIRQLYAQGASVALLAQACGIGTAAVERMVRRKLNRDQVREIRRRYQIDGVCQQVLAQDYGVSDSLISAIVTGKAWRHLSG